MTNKIENVHGQEYADKANQYQELIEKKAKDLVDFLNKEPEARLVPMLKVSENGIIPDIRLALVTTKKNEDVSTGDKIAGEGNGEESGGETKPSEPTGTQTA